MVTGSIPARSPRRAAGLALTAGAVLVLTVGAYVDGAPHHGAPAGRADASTLLTRPVAQMAAWEATGAPAPPTGGEQAQAARRGTQGAGTAPETRTARDVLAVTPSAEASGAPAGEPSAVPSAPPPAGVRPSAAGLPGPTTEPPARLSAPPLILSSLRPLHSLPYEDSRHAPSRSSGPTGPAAQGAGPSASPSGEKSPLAGRQAGEGRVRPGRSLSPMELARAEAPHEQDEPDQPDEHNEHNEPKADPGEMPALTPPPGASPAPERSAPQRPGRQAMDEPAVRQVRQVSLGAGIALVGLGIGFLGLRMRRTN